MVRCGIQRRWFYARVPDCRSSGYCYCACASYACVERHAHFFLSVFGSRIRLLLKGPGRLTLSRPFFFAKSYALPTLAAFFVSAMIRGTGFLLAFCICTRQHERRSL